MNKTIRLSVVLDKKLNAYVEKNAKARGLSKTGFIRLVLSKLKRHGEEVRSYKQRSRN